MFRKYLKDFARRQLRRRGLKLERIPGALLLHPEWALHATFDYVVAHYLTTSGRTGCSFLQIGAYDGVSGDPIHRYVRHHGWTGVLVEPQPYYFNKLRENYSGHPGLQFVNAAVAEDNQIRTLYTLSDPEASDLPRWAPQIASFSRDTLLKHRHAIPNLETRIGEQAVDCVTMDDLIDRFTTDIDIIQIDVEGFDYEILKMIDFTRVRPAIVHFEHKHLSQEAWDGALSLLASKGYQMLVETGDTVAYRPQR